MAAVRRGAHRRRRTAKGRGGLCGPFAPGLGTCGRLAGPPSIEHAAICPEQSSDTVRRAIAGWLAAADCPDAGRDAQVFLEEASGLDRTALRLACDRPIGAIASERLNGWIARRIAGEPVWRILGHREFWGLRFTVTPDVLDPRPDTETLVSAALDALAPRRADRLTIADLGIGSGALLCSLLSELTCARGIGVDKSESACRVALSNLVALGHADRGFVVQGCWSDTLPTGCFDLVVSNPPYIETAVIATLDREVRAHDPRVALDGGVDGLGCYRIIATDLPRVLATEGLAVLEIGAGQASDVRAIMETGGLRIAGIRPDLAGHERAVLLRKA